MNIILSYEKCKELSKIIDLFLQQFDFEKLERPLQINYYEIKMIGRRISYNGDFMPLFKCDKLIKQDILINLENDMRHLSEMRQLDIKT